MKSWGSRLRQLRPGGSISGRCRIRLPKVELGQGLESEVASKGGGRDLIQGLKIVGKASNILGQFFIFSYGLCTPLPFLEKNLCCFVFRKTVFLVL
ncbi:hypothetical protein M5K25_015565 [Dendrobium thyrsiflorum]|uniref:Uncharacterized protein n=1 Tax=Dendrobium thyrsiflorum TaxID=117978 RepID=A0ABD0UR47_DENTH